MTYADPTGRAAFISGLRRLADYLESNPEVPAPAYSVVYTFPPQTGWAEMRAEISAVAAHLDAVPYNSPGSHYVAARHFGPVEYRAVAIPPATGESE